MTRKILSMFIVVTILLGIVTTVSAAERVERSAGSTAFTYSQYKSNTSGTYYCYLTEASSGAFNNENIIHARIRRSSDLAKAGDMASFTGTGQGGYYNYWYGFGDPRNYRVAVDDDNNSAFWIKLNWWP